MIPRVTSLAVLDPHLATPGHLCLALPARELQSSTLWQKCDGIKIFFLNTLLCILEIQKPKKFFWPYRHFKYFRKLMTANIKLKFF